MKSEKYFTLFFSQKCKNDPIHKFLTPGKTAFLKKNVYNIHDKINKNKKKIIS
tara:strand:+ start:293 stop:451 length:159 start_codon:yes stop_codon:yes gene_type:complete